MYTKTILCLANSRKMSGRCIAGKEFDNGRLGAWLRPISARATEELSDDDRNYEDGEDPRTITPAQPIAIYGGVKVTF
jgi:hypothetical protein